MNRLWWILLLVIFGLAFFQFGLYAAIAITVIFVIGWNILKKHAILRFVFVMIFLVGFVTPKTALLSNINRTTNHKNSDSSTIPVPYKIISLKSLSTGNYMTCDIGGKENDRYKHFDDPSVNFDAAEVNSYEMFELVPCSDGYFAIRSIMNRKFLSEDDKSFKADFPEEYELIKMIEDGNNVKLQFKVTNKYVKIGDGHLDLTNNESEAESFTLSTVSENSYSADEIKVLQSSEWFNKDGKGVGYWNIQDELGRGKITSLTDKLEYKAMEYNGETLIGIENMQCVIGVKETGSDYDIIICFQGTGGHGTAILDGVQDGGSNLTGKTYSKDGKHEGYSLMSKKLEGKESNITVSLDGETKTLNDLIEYVANEKNGKSHITILGHSMGGAIAQCYAMHLVERGVSKDKITGRTFNPALAVDHDEDGWKDWYNMCVSTDSVCNGLVPGSICYYGIHRVGDTIWLYDDEPDKKINKGAVGVFTNISEEKHNMDRKIEEILEKSSLSSDK